jgi:hypothetical protein
MIRQGMLGRFGFMAVAASVGALLAATAAPASTVTVGSVLPPGSTPTEFKSVETFFNTALPEKGANLTSPVSGAIVRWRMQDPAGASFGFIFPPSFDGATVARRAAGDRAEFPARPR